MTRFVLLSNYHPDLECLLMKSGSILFYQGSLGSHVSEIINQIQGSTPRVEPVPMATRKCISDFLAWSSANIRNGPEMNVADCNFELKQIQYLENIPGEVLH
jgi:hypothetical protein